MLPVKFVPPFFGHMGFHQMLLFLPHPKDVCVHRLLIGCCEMPLVCRCVIMQYEENQMGLGIRDNECSMDKVDQRVCFNSVMPYDNHNHNSPHLWKSMKCA